MKLGEKGRFNLSFRRNKNKRTHKSITKKVHMTCALYSNSSKPFIIQKIEQIDRKEVVIHEESLLRDRSFKLNGKQVWIFVSKLDQFILEFNSLTQFNINSLNDSVAVAHQRGENNNE